MGTDLLKQAVFLAQVELHMFSPRIRPVHFAFVVCAEILQERKNLQSICMY